MDERNPPVPPPAREQRAEQDPRGPRTSAPRPRAGRLASVVASALVPGLGQALRGRWGDALLLLAAALWLHGFLGAHGQPGARLEAFAFGAPAIPRGLALPVLVVFTVLAVSVHALAAWDAARDAERGEVGEV